MDELTNQTQELIHLLKEQLSNTNTTIEDIEYLEKLYQAIHQTLDDSSKYILTTAIETTKLMVKEVEVSTEESYYENMFKHFGKTVKETRLKKNLSTSDLAKKSGLSISYISNLEKGICNNMAFKSIDVLVRALELPQNEILEIFKWTNLL